MHEPHLVHGDERARQTRGEADHPASVEASFLRHGPGQGDAVHVFGGHPRWIRVDIGGPHLGDETATHPPRRGHLRRNRAWNSWCAARSGRMIFSAVDWLSAPNAR
ncbi:hypothetical protein BBK14_22190 [Parafrankia soli]|uniref:Uncharacterized protein n=1 Tax=Parafrankia soli TaxID=2599596 RepID=A0A1S1PUS3_9ACTN|nr:hypothetical protein BBK14_22190 [Parafrankia soli]